MIGYKVVRKSFDGFVSATILGKVTRYKIGVPTTRHHPGRGPFAVFNTLEGAAYFASCRIDTDEVCIFRAEYTPSEETSLWFADGGQIYSRTTDQLQRGTVLADSVTLLELIERETL